MQQSLPINNAGNPWNYNTYNYGSAALGEQVVGTHQYQYPRGTYILIFA
jgi:hypothetical protein